MRPRLGATAAFGVLLALVAGGCGDPGQEVQADGDEVAALLAAADATDAEGSYRVRIEVEADDPDCTPLFEAGAFEATVDRDAGLMSTHVIADGSEGDLVATEHTVLVPAPLAPTQWGVESGWVEVAEGDDLALLELAGHLDVSIWPTGTSDAEASSASSGWMESPTDVLHEVEALAATVRVVGTEDLDGKATTHYAIEVDGDAYAKMIEDELRAQAEAAAAPMAEAGPGESVPTRAEIDEILAEMVEMVPTDAPDVDVWVDADGLVRRFKVHQPTGGMLAIGTTATADFSDYGVEFSAPERGDVVTFASLGVEPSPQPFGEDTDDEVPGCEIFADEPGTYDEPLDFEGDVADESFPFEGVVDMAESMDVELTDAERLELEECDALMASAPPVAEVTESQDDPTVACFDLVAELMERATPG